MTTFKIPKLEEAIDRMDSVFYEAFSSKDEAMQDWVCIRFALNDYLSTTHNKDCAVLSPAETTPKSAL